MRVLLVSVNREDFPDPTYPLGLELVAAAARRAGHETALLDLRLARGSPSANVSAFRPDVVGVGIRNVDNLTWGRSKSYLGEIASVVAELRGAFPGPLVLGGSGYSLFPGELLEHLEVPWGVVGEGERAFPALLDALASGSEPSGVPGVACRAAPGQVLVGAPQARPVEVPGAFNRGELLERYSREGAPIGVQTKRGCPFRCAYCTYPALEGRALRLREPEEVVEEVADLAGAGVRSVFFVDDAFNVPAEHALAICRGLVERRVDVSWGAFARPGALSAELAHWMRRSGCAGLEFGTDSLDGRVLEALEKDLSVEDVRRAAAAAAEAGLRAAHYLLLGSPGETRETVCATLTALDSLPPAAVIAMAGLRVYPGTALEARARREGCLSRDACLLEPTFYFSPEIRPDELLGIVRERAGARPTWIVPSLGIRCAPELLARLRGRGVPGWTLLLRREAPEREGLRASRAMITS